MNKIIPCTIIQSYSALFGFVYCKYILLGSPCIQSCIPYAILQCWCLQELLIWDSFRRNWHMKTPPESWSFWDPKEVHNFWLLQDIWPIFLKQRYETLLIPQIIACTGEWNIGCQGVWYSQASWVARLLHVSGISHKNLGTWRRVGEYLLRAPSSVLLLHFE